MIWRIVTRYAELTGQEPTCSPAIAYATFDGLFQQALLRHFNGTESAFEDLRAGAWHLITRVVCPSFGGQPDARHDDHVE